jgi:hypothetical protein
MFWTRKLDKKMKKFINVLWRIDNTIEKEREKERKVQWKGEKVLYKVKSGINPVAVAPGLQPLLNMQPLPLVQKTAAKLRIGTLYTVYRAVISKKLVTGFFSRCWKMCCCQGYYFILFYFILLELSIANGINRRYTITESVFPFTV